MNGLIPGSGILFVFATVTVALDYLLLLSRWVTDDPFQGDFSARIE